MLGNEKKYAEILPKYAWRLWKMLREREGDAYNRKSKWQIVLNEQYSVILPAKI